MYKKIIAIAITLLLVISLAGCQKKSTGASSTTGTQTALDKIKQSGKLVVGTEATFPPYESMDTDGKTVIGFDIDLADAIAKKIGVKLKVKDMKFDGLIPSLMNNKIDMVAAGMTVTADRQKSVDFSKIYYTGLQVLVVKADNNSISTGADMNGKKIGAQLGTTSEKIAQSVPGIKYKSMDKVDQLMLSVKNGVLDGVVVDDTVGVKYVKSLSGLKIVKVADLNKDAGGMGIAVQKGNSDLLKVVNDTIDELKSSGEFDKLVDKWDLLK